MATDSPIHIVPGRTPPPPPPRSSGPAAATLPTGCVAGKFMAQHFPQFSQLLKHQLMPPNLGEFTKPYWFAYFWEECGPQSLDPALAGDLAALLDLVFLLPAKWEVIGPNPKLSWVRGSNTFQPLPPNKAPDVLLARNEVLQMRSATAWDNVPDPLLLRVLSSLLASGFIRIPGNPNSTLPTRDSSIDIARFSLTHTGDGRQFMLGWRGDGRKVSQIRDAGGLINKSQSDYQGYAASINLRAAWHPFSLPTNQSDYFFRKNKADNCLHTTVSISTDFRTASVFPLLNEDYIKDLPAALPTEQGLKNSGVMSSSRFHIVVGNAGGPQRLVRVCDRQQLYLVVIEGHYFDTRRAQGSSGQRKDDSQAKDEQFPEVAVKNIPETGVLACLSFVRVHHGLNEHAGCTILYDPARSQAPTIESCRRYAQAQRVATALFEAAEREYNDARRAMPFHVKWTKTKGELIQPIRVNNNNLVISAVKNLGGGSLWG